jgi:RND family efflux transporter MFP subunit
VNTFGAARHRKSALISIVVSTWIGTSCSNLEPRGRADAGPADVTVPVASAVRRDLHTDLSLTAEFEPYQEVEVMAKVSGYVRSIAVDIGDHVRLGQVLASLHIPEMDNELAKAAAAIEQSDAELAVASGEAKRADAAHDIAHLLHDRLKRAAERERGLVPQQEVDETRAKDLAAEAESAAGLSRLAAAKQRAGVSRAEEARVRTLSQYASIVAPFDGVVTKRYANVGAMIQAGTASQTQAMPVVRLSDSRTLRLVLPVPEQHVPRVHVGQDVAVHVPALNRTISGRVARISGRVQQATRTMDTQVDIGNPDLVLVPGMYARVDLRIEAKKGALTIPLDAVERTGEIARVFRVQDNQVRVTPVKLGMETPQVLEVVSGIGPGDVVVVGRRSDLRDGQKVQVKPIDAGGR